MDSNDQEPEWHCILWAGLERRLERGEDPVQEMLPIEQVLIKESSEQMETARMVWSACPRNLFVVTHLYSK